jgi:DNA-binding CsgD family transcriptional regulator
LVAYIRAVDPAVLWERERALDAIDAVLKSVSNGAGRAVFIVGHPGLGKTALLSAAQASVGPGVRVVSARGSQREQDLRFAFAEQIMGAQVVSLNDIDTDSEEDVSGRRSRVFGRTRTGLRSWANDGPTLLLLDDLHWADLDSIDLVAFLTRRLQVLPVGLIAALRPWPPAALSMIETMLEPGVEVVDLDPLSRAAAGSLLADLVGSEVAPALIERAWALAGGNPLLAREVARIIGTDGYLPDTGGQEGASVRRTLLLSHLAGLPPEAMVCARAAAVLGRTARLAALRAVSGLDEDDFARAYDTLRSAGTLGSGGQAPAEFGHELVSDAVYEDIPTAQRQLLHRRAFRFYLGLRDVEAAAPQAVAADLVGDESAVATVVEAGVMALRAGGVETGLGFIAAGVKLAGPQPPAALVVRHADALFAVGRPGEAIGLYRSVLDRGCPELADLPMKLARAQVFAGDFDGGVSSFSRLLDQPEALGPALLATILERNHAVWQRDGPGGALVVLDADVARHPEMASVPLVAATRSFLLLQTGDPSGLPTIDAGATNLREQISRDPLQALGSYSHLLIIPALGMVDRYQEALELIDEVLGWLWSYGQLRGIGPMRLDRLGILLLQGQLATVVREAEDMEEEHDLDTLLAPFAWLLRSQALVWLGRADEAEELCRRSERSPGIRAWYAHLNLLTARAQIQLAEGQVLEASDSFRRVETLADRMGIRAPHIAPWVAHAMEAHVASGRMADVRRVAGRLEQYAGKMGWPGARMIAAGGRAALAAAEGEESEAERLYREALGLPCVWPLDRARIQLRYGEWLRRRHEDLKARPQLTEAASLAQQCGAVDLAQQAAAELAAAGGRRRLSRNTSGLTAQEARAVDLAITGATVREIASEMHLSPRTVESHLAHAYDKLGVNSKQELRRRRRELLQ